MINEFKADPRLLATQYPHCSNVGGGRDIDASLFPVFLYFTAVTDILVSDWDTVRGAGESRRGKQIEAINRICSSSIDRTFMQIL